MNSNPVQFLLNDQQFQLLAELNLLNKKLLRDLEIRGKYHTLRAKGVSFMEALDYLLQEYPYLQPDTLRKLIYSRAVTRIEQLSRIEHSQR
jgi:5'-deoxynucleotidase YfbR-like HD superfamily hydrolase